MSNGSICSTGIGRRRNKTKTDHTEPRLVKRYRNCVVLRDYNGWQDEILIHHCWRR
jgi:hypothetical protein